MEFGTVTLRLPVDGSDAPLVTVATGAHAHGQGHDTTFAMIAGELLGLPMDDIAIVHGDTDRVPAGLGQLRVALGAARGLGDPPGVRRA